MLREVLCVLSAISSCKLGTRKNWESGGSGGLRGWGGEERIYMPCWVSATRVRVYECVVGVVGVALDGIY